MSKLEFKKCIDCNKEYPATTEFFHQNGKKLQVRCKKCHNILRNNNRKKEKENSNKSRLVFSEKEEKSFSEKAKEFNMSRTDFIKLMVLKSEGEILVKIEPKCFDVFNNQIMGMATNINQIAHVCNTANNVYQVDVENLRNEFKKIREWQQKLEEEFKIIDTSIRYAHEVFTFDDI
ncbi:plasmid mobilization relaxosome protein MobC [Clostridium estertheticum]|uniref:plasmid mobilization relaxosome protein MobC n=1 Tax=Clostridium estertheticum TaxID=238834 RepID=UPI001C7DED3D|nr:plasmid mobilization relaxosome protein MobC [Clostridium estertheticum]MBX4267144.1 MobC family plasmid mobilization relaxosome protein [Clostridium estertheticum]MBX4272219.1 MobC family plasmid mobilization relaxosome protein [Clostridium estertheticum]WLC82447.1 MobC family plasmid mobilization relaxosome protein [Clostridium estertheticum]WLC91321.1 MobC family plasmid mobilization relaxosome protein [Clostridium estertheticum]